MTSTIVWNLALTIPFLAAYVGIPLWMTWKHLDRAPDHTAAHRYLAAKAARVTAAPSGAARVVTARGTPGTLTPGTSGDLVSARSTGEW
jgi:hypothetical protein